MDWAIYGALIAGFLSVTGAAAFLGVRVLGAWRDLKRLRRQVVRALGRLAELTEATAVAAERAGDQTRLTASTERLRVSLARLAVIRGALDEATGAFGRIVAVYPRK